MVNIELRNNVSEMRSALAEALVEQLQANRDVVYLDADLVGALGTKKVFEQCPKQCFNVGIMEANMLGVAAGMSINGKIPFVHSFGTFASRRIADQIFLSGCYNGANVKILGSDPGIAAETNGGTHMPLEDMGVLRSFPGMVILDIADTRLMREMVKCAVETYGMLYMRFPRKGVRDYYPADTAFRVGKGMVLREGTDVTLVACGLLVVEALDAAQQLAQQGVSARVVDMFTIKPLDTELIKECAIKTGAIVTAENHNHIGGLGSAVAEAVCDTVPVPVARVGALDRFGEVGSRAYLAEKFGMTAKDIVVAAQLVMQKKR